MRVKRDFEKIYKEENDPWSIGDADSERYNLYREVVSNSIVENKHHILDIGSGFGAFLSKFKDEYNCLTGVDTSHIAITKGKERFPFIKYVQSPVHLLHKTPLENSLFDTIIYSDVIYYLDEKQKNFSLSWISNHLAPGGLAFIAAWCPGGKYLEYDELKQMIEKYFLIENDFILDSQHGVFLARKKRHLVSITVDYETWQPIPEGKQINWDKDIFEPTSALLDICDQEEVKITLFAEMGEYFWLKENNVDVAGKMEAQWMDAVSRGHDVQLHLHPNWLPELGARFEDGHWYWDWSKANATDYPDDLTELIRRCKTALESVIHKVNSDYQVTSFRAGAYRAQPFNRLYEALVKNDIFCDSSVYSGGISKDRGYDYTCAYSNHQPYFANPYDPQLKATPQESKIIEIPVFTYQPNERWFLDDLEGQKFADRLLSYVNQTLYLKVNNWYRIKNKIRSRFQLLYEKLNAEGKFRNLFFPKKTVYNFYKKNITSTDQNHQYYVMIGHSKAKLYFDDIASNLKKLKRAGFEFLTLSELAHLSREKLTEDLEKYQVDGLRIQAFEKDPLFRLSERKYEQFLEEQIPLDKVNLLELGCFDGRTAVRLSEKFPWMRVTAIEKTTRFVEHNSAGKVLFKEDKFDDMSFADESFDSVYTNNALIYEDNVSKVLSEIYRVLKNNGVFVGCVFLDAENSKETNAYHLWKTTKKEIDTRLTDAGFSDMELQEIDTYTEFGMSPYAPSNNKILFFRAWKREATQTCLDRALEIMNWTYHHLNPEKSFENSDYVDILREGYAYCWGYSVVLGHLLKREGYSVRWLTMLAHDHPRGRGEQKVDSHEVVLVHINGKETIFDPMANTLIPYSLKEVLLNPERAEEKNNPDERYRSRGYHYYDTSFWYSRVVKYAIRTDVNNRIIFWKKQKGSASQ